jgi:voltage-gated potassium channel
MLSRLRIAVYISLIIIVFAVGTAGVYFFGHYQAGFNEPINSFVTAAYVTVITLSTVGYGDFVPVTTGARVFIMVLIVSGLGIFLSALTFVSSEFVNARVATITGRINPFERRLLKEHIILVGSDTVNMRMAEKLKEKNMRFIILSSNKEIIEQYREQGYRAFVVDETDEEAMKKFEIGKAKSIIIDMRDKSRMVYAILIIRNLAEKSKIVAVAHNTDEEKHIRNMGASIGIVSPFEIVSNMLIKKIEELED